ncbi:MAG TPA: peptide ABC transporter substrate-binding protein [Gemmatimonadales bacterium]|jgi:peptide/nickel transport system substrate-binding protein
MRRAAVLLIPVLLVSCSRSPAGCSGDFCGTVVFAAIGQPSTLLPPLGEALERDIHDQIFLKLADIGPDGNTIGDKGFEPQLADRWGWTDSLTLAFHLNPKARWQDGPPVTAGDVAFTFRAFSDSEIGSNYRENLSRIASVTAQDSATAVFHFRTRYPEMFYDAAYQLRILPQHLLDSLPYPRWRGSAFGRAPVGDGPYRFVSWTPDQSLELAADSTFFLGRPHIRRLIWRFAADPQTAIAQVIAGEADAIEVLLSPPNIDRAKKTAHLTVYPYAGSAYTFLDFNLHARGGSGPHPVFSDVAVRRALILATDRERMVTNVWGTAAKVPPAPIPQAWKALWFNDLPIPAFDTTRAKHMLDSAGWRDTGHTGVRQKGSRKLAFSIRVPSTSAARKQYAQLIQEQLRRIGVQVTIEESDNPTFQQKYHAGDYDAAIQTYVNDPTPSSGVPQTWRSTGDDNAGHYSDPAFDHQLDLATHAPTPDDALRAWKAAFVIFAADAPAMMLNAPDNVAAVDKRITNVRIRPDSYWAYLWTWRIPADRLIDRDRLER